MTRVINLFGGPGTGKSTTAAAIFSELKYRNINCEMALEYAKDRVWEGSEVVLDNQIYIFGKQHHRIWRLLDKVDYIITDSPLLNSILYYQGGNEFFPRCVFEEHQKLENTNIFLVREKPYNPAGRVQTEEKARLLDQRIVGILEYLGQDFHTVTADKYAASNKYSRFLCELWGLTQRLALGAGRLGLGMTLNLSQCLARAILPLDVKLRLVGVVL